MHHRKRNLILQQTNCTALYGNGKGLACNITNKWPHVTPYQRERIAELGSIQIYHSIANSPVVCCLNAQMYVGRKLADENYDNRHVAFRRCVHVAICDKCIDRYCLLNTLSLFSSPWRKIEHPKEKNLRRQSESHTFNYKTYWECGSNDWKRRKSDG